MQRHQNKKTKEQLVYRDEEGRVQSRSQPKNFWMESLRELGEIFRNSFSFDLKESLYELLYYFVLLIGCCFIGGVLYGAWSFLEWIHPLLAMVVMIPVFGVIGFKLFILLFNVFVAETCPPRVIEHKLPNGDIHYEVEYTTVFFFWWF